MTPEQTLTELLGRIGASKGEAVLVSEEELGEWPDGAVTALKDAGLLSLASLASSVVCPGCEQECSMPVTDRLWGNGKPVLFVVCDKREDIGRVPISSAKVRQWMATSLAVGSLIARLLGIAGGPSSKGLRCELGILRGRRHSSHVVLTADGRMRLGVAGHVVDLESILTIVGQDFMVDRRALERFVDNPIAGGGDKEGAQQRRLRLARDVEVEKALGNRAFLKTVAGREGISTTRLKQVLEDVPSPARNQSTTAKRRPG
jgi:hypothetical protein